MLVRANPAGGCAVQGRPIYIQHLGQINTKALYELTSEERMIKFHVQVTWARAKCGGGLGPAWLGPGRWRLQDAQLPVNNRRKQSRPCAVPLSCAQLNALPPRTLPAGV